MRTIAIGDIHGEYSKLQVLMSKLQIDFNKDIVVFLGDYIDRGEDPYKVVKYIRRLKTKYPKNVICLRGNHEQMAIDDNHYHDELWKINGGKITKKSYYKRRSQKEMYQDIQWFNTLPLIYENDDNIFVHGGYDPSKKSEEQNAEYVLWAREEYLFDGRKFPKKVISGHTPTVSMKMQGYIDEETMPYRTSADNIIIDTSACYNGVLTACIIDDKNKGYYTFINSGESDKKLTL